MICCPHCHAKAKLSKIIFSSKKKPYVCPECSEYSMLPGWQQFVLILIAGTGLAAQLDRTQVDHLLGQGLGEGIFIISFLLAWAFLRYVCTLLPLTPEAVSENQKLKVSWWLGGPITPTSFIIFSAVGVFVAVCHSYFFVHRPLSTILPVLLLSVVPLGIVFWIRFRR